MDIRRPKPIHELGEFAKEVGIIVVGVLIALAGEQVVETLRWAHRAELSEAAMRKELAVDLAYAVEQRGLSACADRYLDRLQGAIGANRPDIVARLHALGPPLDGHPWTSDTWTAAVSGQVTDHLPRERVAAYSTAFRFVAANLQNQWELIDLHAQAMAGRFGRLDDPGVAADQLKAVDRLRAKEAQRDDINDALLKTGRTLGVAPSVARAEEFKARVRACETGLAAIPGA